MLRQSPARYEASQVGAKSNAVQKEIGQLKKVSRSFLWHLTLPNNNILQAKQDASKQLEQKIELDKEKKRLDDVAVEKEKHRDLRCKTIGNYVHESVPVHDNEV